MQASTATVREETPQELDLLEDQRRHILPPQPVNVASSAERPVTDIINRRAWRQDDPGLSG